MKAGDLVVHPSKQDKQDKQDKQVHIGRVTGPYQHFADATQGYPHRRSVQWLSHLPRLQFTQGALLEIGSALSLFQVKNYADEFRAAVGGKSAPALSVDQDHSGGLVTNDMEDTTRDFVLKCLAQELKGLPLEDFVVHLLQCMGYHARKTRVNEPSVDVIATRTTWASSRPSSRRRSKAAPTQ